MTSPADSSGATRVLAPLFPLPNVVLFPRAVLPLHIFEERYKQMTADALQSGDKRVAMALLRPGWEKNYYSRPAIEQVVCVGKILTWERLGDGTYNFLLQGVLRGQVKSEVPGKSYRVAEIEALEESNVLEIDLSDHRRRLQMFFTEGPWSNLAIGKQFREMFASSMTTAAIADLVAFSFLEDVGLKQQLLAEPDILARVRRVIEAMDNLRPRVQAVTDARASGPSMN